MLVINNYTNDYRTEGVVMGSKEKPPFVESKIYFTAYIYGEEISGTLVSTTDEVISYEDALDRVRGTMIDIVKECAK